MTKNTTQTEAPTFKLASELVEGDRFYNLHNVLSIVTRVRVAPLGSPFARIDYRELSGRGFEGESSMRLDNKVQVF